VLNIRTYCNPLSGNLKNRREAYHHLSVCEALAGDSMRLGKFGNACIKRMQFSSTVHPLVSFESVTDDSDRKKQPHRGYLQLRQSFFALH
jgi:hypothetical protein